MSSRSIIVVVRIRLHIKPKVVRIGHAIDRAGLLYPTADENGCVVVAYLRDDDWYITDCTSEVRMLLTCIGSPAVVVPRVSPPISVPGGHVQQAWRLSFVIELFDWWVIDETICLLIIELAVAEALYGNDDFRVIHINGWTARTWRRWVRRPIK